MSVVKEKFILTLSYEMSVDTSTGEILETKLIDRKVDKSDIKVTKKVIAEDSDTEPKLVLESNKYCLNGAAIALMGIGPNDKLDVKYDDGKATYKFITNSDGTCTAKTPMGLFNEIYIDNDLDYVVKRIKEYNEED